MRARYIGDPHNDGHGPNVLVAFGLSFRKGEWVDISGNEHALKKIPNNTHFEMDKGKAPAVKPPAAPAAKAPAAPPPPPPPPAPPEIPADWAGLHHTKRIALARQVSGGEVKTAAVADAILTAHTAPETPLAAAEGAPPAAKADDDDGFSDLDPE